MYNGFVSTVKRFFVVALGLALLGITGTSARAQQAFGKYFTETGHNVVGDFWTFYQGVADAAVVFGYPITDQFVTAFPPGLQVQYFQRARFEYHPELPEGQRVQLTPLGTVLYKAGAPAMNLNTPGACRSFPTNYAVCFSFLDYFDQHSGAARFGNPVSAIEFRPDGRVVQYFERARFEWHPELASGQNILLADLGMIYFATLGEDPARLRRFPPLDGIIVESPQVTAIRALAFVGKAFTLPADTQDVYIIVLDQAHAPVSNVTGFIIVHPPAGGDQTFRVTTDAKGIGVVRGVTFSGQTPGSLIEVYVEMNLGNLKASTITSFRIWR